MCLICDRIEMIKNGTNPYFVKELETWTRKMNYELLGMGEKSYCNTASGL